MSDYKKSNIITIIILGIILGLSAFFDPEGSTHRGGTNESQFNAYVIVFGLLIGYIILFQKDDDFT